MYVYKWNIYARIYMNYHILSLISSPNHSSNCEKIDIFLQRDSSSSSSLFTPLFVSPLTHSCSISLLRWGRRIQRNGTNKKPGKEKTARDVKKKETKLLYLCVCYVCVCLFFCFLNFNSGGLSSSLTNWKMFNFLCSVFLIFCFFDFFRRRYIYIFFFYSSVCIIYHVILCVCVLDFLSSFFLCVNEFSYFLIFFVILTIVGEGKLYIYITNNNNLVRRKERTVYTNTYTNIHIHIHIHNTLQHNTIQYV